MIVKPMLGTNAVLDKIKYPVFASPKLDGIRAIITDEGVLSRSGKLIPNLCVQAAFKSYIGFDGELIVGNPTAPDVFNKTTSGVMTKIGCPEVTLYVFDYWRGDLGIFNRYRYLINRGLLPGYYMNNVFLIEQIRIDTPEELAEFEAKQLEKGFEGIMIRNPEAPYKHGRSTVKEGGLLKIKRFTDSEAIVIGYEPYMRNNNEPVKDELGYTKRSTSIKNLEELPMLGNLIVEDATGTQFSIGSGFTQKMREELWEQKESLINKIIKYKHFPIGVIDKPRFPIFVGFRDKEDMSND